MRAKVIAAIVMYMMLCTVLCMHYARVFHIMGMRRTNSIATGKCYVEYLMLNCV